jgi:hypothetical protein
MAPRIRMPSEDDLPDGPRRELVEELFVYYREAGRPTLRSISDYIASRDDLAGTASKETIRRMLQGISVPAQWETAHAVFLALCRLAGAHSEGPRSPNNRATRQSVFKELWNTAIDEPDTPAQDPWAGEVQF